jgi:hypothetical protein
MLMIQLNMTESIKSQENSPHQTLICEPEQTIKHSKKKIKSDSSNKATSN